MSLGRLGLVSCHLCKARWPPGTSSSSANELHFPVSEGHIGRNVLVRVKHQVIVLPAARVLLILQRKLMYSLRQTRLPGRGINMGQPDINRAALAKSLEFGSHHKKTSGCSGLPSCPLLPQLSCSAGPASPYQAGIPNLHMQISPGVLRALSLHHWA